MLASFFMCQELQYWNIILAVTGEKFQRKALMGPLRRRGCLCTRFLLQRELLQHQKSRAGALQACPLQNLLQDLLAVVERSLCKRTGECDVAAATENLRLIHKNPTMKPCFSPEIISSKSETDYKNTPECKTQVLSGANW